ncbi:membrane fusion protein, multidrug efflux system [Chitinophaga terrae (ex Kim and Jung 2007)]|jgi:membrane fusion protein (multidrug efflux system)|uniref:Membrane fusion protein, multidrug efflux system n=1 Tax=Chitinophaga terrae (ex Kim and Jung 2007) TaxID=408074 RepID=A0A1H4CPD4_9BACT|nr:efflux RND transporter periplasmic adaptor subunit [Chitinophaga terrae (ex Kim and Jung 2007)]MDQ0105177.1 membrane fusion protein (multidrug efflux system) [Chitinophaga terrae (ex Kim and Jung 2007)]GEP90367.1 MexH family multidrug efflux RND transporter periplasmic adaptor subunit [Chitinophaga terrae (ex Kim and Jung 2007)]SEA62251.1 membrane fusion protein, multidrug efflux system [Chitinophaga terrae (ex Kim and Jung 2007)]
MAITKKTVRTILILAVACIAIFFLYKKIAGSKASGEPSAQNAKSSGPKLLLTDAWVVKTGLLNQTIEASGTLQSNEEVEVKPEINGRIIKLFFKEGTNVRKGDMLVKLYDEDLKAQLQKLKLQQQLAKTTLERQENLLKINGISQQDVDVTRNQVSAYQADMEYTQTQLQKTELRAPFSGKLGLRNVSEGAIVSSATIITTLQQIDPLKMDFAVAEKYRNAVKVGDQVIFNVAGDRNDYKGSIYAIDPKIDLTTRTMKLRAIVPNNSGVLFPGSFAKVKIILKDIPDAMMIPSQAVIPGTRDKKVIIADQGVAKFVVVETGQRTESSVQITNGLKPGDTVITTGILQLKPGMPLKYNKIQ